MSNGRKRGLPIGGYPSQAIGNFNVSDIDHHMKEKMRAKCYLRYCDDTMGLARTKAEAWMMANEYERQAAAHGLVVKAGLIVAPIAHKDEKKHKRRKRQRGRGKRSKN